MDATLPCWSHAVRIMNRTSWKGSSSTQVIFTGLCHTQRLCHVGVGQPSSCHDSNTFHLLRVWTQHLKEIYSPGSQGECMSLGARHNLCCLGLVYEKLCMNDEHFTVSRRHLNRKLNAENIFCISVDFRNKCCPLSLCLLIIIQSVSRHFWFFCLNTNRKYKEGLYILFHFQLSSKVLSSLSGMHICKL